MKAIHFFRIFRLWSLWRFLAILTFLVCLAGCTRASITGMKKSAQGSASSSNAADSTNLTKKVSPLAKPMAGYVVLSGAGISRGTGMMVIGSVGQPVAPSAVGPQSGTNMKAISNIQGSFYQVLGK